MTFALNALDLRGRRFGSLTVVRRHENAGPKIAQWLCRCDCGKQTVVRRSNLCSGNTRSCGHLGIGNNVRHGHTREGGKSPIYRVWTNMIQRCTDRNATSWTRYGGRGIKVCKRWLVFENFLQDMGQRPAGLTIDRKNNYGNYTPRNCRWATYKQQAQNRRPAC